MVKIKLFCTLMTSMCISLYAMNTDKYDSKQLKDIQSQGRYNNRELIGYSKEEEPEYVQLWKEWMDIKNPSLPHFPFRDAAENVEQLRWLVQKRKEELSQKHAK